MKKLIATSALLGISLGAQADGYRGEISGGFVSGTDSSSYSYSPPGDYEPPVEPGEPVPEPVPGSFPSSEDYDGWRIGGRIYLDTVEANQGPLALAPFLQRADHVGLTLSNTETDSGAETDEWVLDSRFVLNDLVLAGYYGQADTETFGADSDAELIRAAVGYYVARSTQVRGAYEITDSDTGEENSRYVIDITHVQNLNNGMTWSANALAGWVTEDDAIGTGDDGTDLNLSFDWFFNDNTNLGTELTLNSRDIAGDTFSYEVHGEYFINDYVSLRLSYFDQDYDDADVEADAFMFQVLYRR